MKLAVPLLELTADDQRMRPWAVVCFTAGLACVAPLVPDKGDEPGEMGLREGGFL